MTLKMNLICSMNLNDLCFQRFNLLIFCESTIKNDSLGKLPPKKIEFYSGSMAIMGQFTIASIKNLIIKQPPLDL